MRIYTELTGSIVSDDVASRTASLVGVDGTVAPLLADTHREFQERTGQAILERYGMSETNMITTNPYDGDRIAGRFGCNQFGGTLGGPAGVLSAAAVRPPARRPSRSGR